MRPQKSDVQWYCQKDSEAERFYDLFFAICQKYHVSLASASEKENAFIEEITKVTYLRLFRKFCTCYVFNPAAA